MAPIGPPTQVPRYSHAMGGQFACEGPRHALDACLETSMNHESGSIIMP